MKNLATNQVNEYVENTKFEIRDCLSHVIFFTIFAVLGTGLILLGLYPFDYHSEIGEKITEAGTLLIAVGLLGIFCDLAAIIRLKVELWHISKFLSVFSPNFGCRCG